MPCIWARRALGLIKASGVSGGATIDLEDMGDWNLANLGRSEYR